MRDDDDNLVQIDSRYATVGDFEAHAQHALATAVDQEQRTEAQRMLAVAAIALERAGGNRAVRLSAIADENYLPKN
jgi:hypothetical protein